MFRRFKIAAIDCGSKSAVYRGDTVVTDRHIFRREARDITSIQVSAVNINTVADYRAFYRAVLDRHMIAIDTDPRRLRNICNAVCRQIAAVQIRGCRTAIIERDAVVIDTDLSFAREIRNAVRLQIGAEHIPADTAFACKIDTVSIKAGLRLAGEIRNALRRQIAAVQIRGCRTAITERDTVVIDTDYCIS